MAKLINSSGIMKARIITPGQGSTCYYSEALLQKIAPKFDGAQVYWDHPTTAEESTRPERSLRDLAGKILPGTSTWQFEGSDGAGIYADVQVYKPYQEAVNELGPDIGMSIRANGKGREALVNGKKTMVIESIDSVASVDFVTLPGRGGKPLQLFEAARAAGRAAAITEVQEAKDAMKKCPTCKGTGDCAGCDGSGKVPKTQEAASKRMKDCPDCKGSGDCPDCEGEGKVSESARHASARPQQQQQGDISMDEATIKRLVESAVTAAVAPLEQKLTEARAQHEPLLKRALRGDAREEAARLLESVRLPQVTRDRIIQHAVENVTAKDGAIDTAKLKESVDAMVKSEGEYLGQLNGGARVIGHGELHQRPSTPKRQSAPPMKRRGLSRKLRTSSPASWEIPRRPSSRFAKEGRPNQNDQSTQNRRSALQQILRLPERGHERHACPDRHHGRRGDGCVRSIHWRNGVLP